jgi:hypothetical protein
MSRPGLATNTVGLLCYVSATLALLSGGLTLYIILGLLLEERDLPRRVGTACRP